MPAKTPAKKVTKMPAKPAAAKKVVAKSATPRLGRPRSPHGQNRIYVRATDERQERWKMAAIDDGRDLASWITRTLDAAADLQLDGRRK